MNPAAAGPWRLDSLAKSAHDGGVVVASCTRAWLRAHPELTLAVSCYLLLFFGFSLVGLLSIGLDRPMVVRGTWLELLMRHDEPNPDLVRLWERWDALWYMQIAQHGYQSTDNTTAFFPLYPLLVHGVGVMVHENYALAGLIVSGTALIGALMMLNALVQHLACPTVARRTVLYTALFPTAFFLVAPYSESLFLLLVVSTFWCMEQRRWALAGAVGLLAGLTRAQGALLLLPMVWMWLEQRDRGEARWLPSFFWTITPGLGLLAFTAYIRFVVGQDTAGLSTQAAWGYRVVAPWNALAASVGQARVDPIEAMNLASVVLFAVLSILGLRRLPLPYTVYSAASIGLIVSRQMEMSPLMSVSRYMLVVFPCLVVLASFVERRNWLHQSLCATGLVLATMLFAHHTHFRFVA
jgi:hypothetical protein